VPRRITIAIDGPAASGKTTLGQRLARELGYLFFDTGVMYRAITFIALKQCVELNNEKKVVELAYQTNIDVQPPSIEDGRVSDILANGEDITWEIRSPEVDANVSLVSSYAGVRDALTKQQRRIAQKGSIVMVGRDIGTVVLPDADIKFYLDASAEERANRRYKEITERGDKANFESILQGVKKRDQIDSNRDIAPLRPAEDAIIIESDDMNADEVLKFALKIVKEFHKKNNIPYFKTSKK